MCKPEIQSVASLVLCILNVVVALFLSQRIPDTIAPLVLIKIVRLCAKEHENNNNVYNHKVGISAMILGFVILSIDEKGADISDLDGHLDVEIYKFNLNAINKK